MFSVQFFFGHLFSYLQERQRDKDSPYNFNIPPQMSIDLDTYEKTGETKITTLKIEVGFFDLFEKR